jgi:hypothetical protein
MVTGIYCGEHPDHKGQGEDNYLHGVQVNDQNDESGERIVIVMDSEVVANNTKSFALRSISSENGTLVDARTGIITVHQST